MSESKPVVQWWEEGSDGKKGGIVGVGDSGAQEQGAEVLNATRLPHETLTLTPNPCTRPHPFTLSRGFWSV